MGGPASRRMASGRSVLGGPASGSWPARKGSGTSSLLPLRARLFLLSLRHGNKGSIDLVFGFELDSIMVDGVDGKFSIAVGFRGKSGRGGAFVWRCTVVQDTARLGRGGGAA